MADEHQRPPISIGWRARVLAGGVAIVVSFALCEVAARMVYPTPPQPAREPQLLFRSDPEVGFVHVPSQSGFLDDGWATINRLGLRGEEPEARKPESSVRVLAVGDSTTFGWGVNDGETYTETLRRMLAEAEPRRAVSVVNAGVSAYNLKQTAALLKRLAPSLKPDIVLVGLFWNDLPYEAVSPDGVPQTAPSSATPAAAGGPARTFRLANQPSRMNRLLRSSRVVYVLRHAWLKAIAPTEAATNQVQWEMALLDGRKSAAIDAAWKDIAATLGEIRRIADVEGFAVGLVIIPIRAQVEGEFPNAEYQTRARAIAESLRMFVVDPLPGLRDAPDRASLFIPYDRMHFSASGNAAIARATFDELRGRPELTTSRTSAGDR